MSSSITTLKDANEQILKWSLKCAALEMEHTLGGLRDKDVSELASDVSRVASWCKIYAPKETPSTLSSLQKRVRALQNAISVQKGSFFAISDYMDS